jgi:hypothetical protein
LFLLIIFAIATQCDDTSFTDAALKLLRKLFRNQEIYPETMTVDKLSSYRAQQLKPLVFQAITLGRQMDKAIWANNQADASLSQFGRRWAGDITI